MIIRNTHLKLTALYDVQLFEFLRYMPHCSHLLVDSAPEYLKNKSKTKKPSVGECLKTHEYRTLDSVFRSLLEDPPRKFPK